MRFFRFTVALALSLALIAAGAWLLLRDGRTGGSENAPTAAIPPRGLQEPGPEEDLCFARKEIDLGSVKGPIHFNFDYQNRSKRVIRKVRIAPSCNCTVTRPDKDELQPGERGRFAVDIAPRGQPVGRQAYVITVEYEGDSRRQVRLLIRAHHTPDITVPESVAIRSVPGREGSATFALVDYRDHPLDITSISTSSAGLKAVIESRPGSYLPGWQYLLRATFTSDRLEPGDYTETIVLHTTDPDRGEITIGANIHRVRRIRVAPAVLSLHPAQGDGPELMGRCYLDDTAGDPVAIASITPSHPAIRCKTPREKKVRHLIEVVCDAQAIALPKTCTIRILVREPVAEEATVQVLLPSPSGSASRP